MPNVCIFAVATYYLRSLTQAVRAPAASKAQKYRFLGNYFKDLPEDLDGLLQELRQMVNELEELVQGDRNSENPNQVRTAALALCEEIKVKAALPEVMYQVLLRWHVWHVRVLQEPHDRMPVRVLGMPSP